MRREQVRYMIGKGLSERCALAVVRMSASAYRYESRPDRNVELRERILALAQRDAGNFRFANVAGEVRERCA